ncbi:tryptophan 2,3-dioxygenase family protein [Actinocorallia sp. B10E7]|uniref:tryptophan 2,3-dioxygenase family protein n=1 Tax=Actinocorallia sp. B10E7 TaxID=3153558 RepID=UPI00325C7609
MSADPNPYEAYVRVRELLALHVPRTDVPAEGLFITVHQVSELWLATLLRELPAVTFRLSDADVPGAIRHLRVAVRVMSQLSSALDVLGMMLPTEFAEFREELGRASAIQSRQYAALVQACRGPGPCLREAFGRLAAQKGGLGEVYRRPGGLRDAAELLVDFDDAFADWMGRHWRLARRQIGDMKGTGGHSADYLRLQLDERLFPELIEARNRLYEPREVPSR